MNKNLLIICRGGGDLATGIAHRLHCAGYRVLILETQEPAAIRRRVSFCEAVYEGEAVVENVRAVRINITDLWAEMQAVFADGGIPLLVDPEGMAINMLMPDIVIDAIIAKKNLGTRMSMAPLVIGAGPGFTAGEDVHYVIETKRGHNLGRIIAKGSAAENTGIPGNIGGFTSERVIHAPEDGSLRNVSHIGDVVEQGQVIARILKPDGTEIPVEATITGVLRGLIKDRYRVTKGLKIADIDPRKEEQRNCFTISDKARCIAGSVLELVSAYANR